MKLRGFRVVAVTVALFLIVPHALAETLPDRTERVIGLGRVWAKVKFFHPYLAYKDIDWDAALVAAIPKAEAATTVTEYRAAVQGMLAALRDPVTRVIDTPAPPAKPSLPADWLTTPAPGVVYLKLAGMLGAGIDFAAMRANAAKVTTAAAGKVLVIDTRGASRVDFAVESFADALPAIDAWPLERAIEHRGFRTQEGQTSGGYFSTFVTTGARPPKPASKAGATHVVFAVDGNAPAVALALQAAGHATIVSTVPLREEDAVSGTSVDLAGKITAQVRFGELLWGPPAADVTIGKTDDLEARATAVAKRAGGARPKPKAVAALPQYRPRDDLDYADQPYPSRELRMLAGIRMWAVIDAFFPYRSLIADWDGVLREMLPRLADAPDRETYRRVLRQMSVRIGDGHVGIRVMTPDPAAKPRGMPSFETRLVEGKLAIVHIIDAEVKRQGLGLGDVIETVDGTPVAKLIADKRSEVTGSTDEARDQRIAGAVLAGDDGSTVKLGVRGADGKLRDATFVRSAVNMTMLSAPPAMPPQSWKKLPGNIGYVDLTELVAGEVDRMFADLETTRAIVFDMRGYPKRTLWAITPHLNIKKAKFGAMFLEPLVFGEGSDSRIQFMQPIDSLPATASLYTGKIVMLVDDRAISQAEHECLFFEAAAGATFIGSPTHGANGDVTQMRLPGGLRMSFTGQEVRHADGRKLQKVGVQPDVVVRPTLAGIRAGKDEVLDRALAWLAAHK